MEASGIPRAPHSSTLRGPSLSEYGASAPPLCCWYTGLPHPKRDSTMGLLSQPGSGNCWSQTTPLQRGTRGSPRLGRGESDGALRSQDERPAWGHCPWPPVQLCGGGEGVPGPLGPGHGASAYGSSAAWLVRALCSGKLLPLPGEPGSPGWDDEVWGVRGSGHPACCLPGSAQTARLWCRVWF